ncbi:MAG TPA: hypothetical protein VNY70_00060 [Steroidobacteraceae bacterium]|nr:hypothetical protein [Steroidobacteraceae bacterium]
MTPQPELADDELSDATAGQPPPSAAAGGPFVLNLCSSTTPMALAQTELPELRRFNFFVSRRFEEGRERFRLHMGYFSTLAEAEEWLNVVREIYPGAWAGEAPGRKLRERAASANATQAQHAAGPQSRGAVTTAHTATRVAVPAPRPQAGPPPSVRVPVVHAAPQAALRSAPRPTAAPVARPAAQVSPAARYFPPPQPAARVAPAPDRSVRQVPTAARVAARPAVSAPAARAATPGRAATPTRAPTPARAVAATRAATPARPAAPAARPRAAAPVRPSAPIARGGAPGRTPARPAFQDSNVREVLAALGETSKTGETRLMQLPPPPRNAQRADGALSDTQVLRVLEERRPDNADRSGDAQARNIPLLKPDDTGTRRALKDAVARNAPVWFSVQLQWSVQPVELERVPPLAIFSAYTLYTVEGSREGRHWYGLRLGFFSDAISAKQVAYYVRSEFGSVAVVPVSPEERARATADEKAAAILSAPEAAPRPDAEEFKLIDVREQPHIPARRVAAPKPAVKKPAAPAAKARSARDAGRVGIRERRGGPTLEETLEILGASELTIEDGRNEIVNDTGVRHLRVEVQKNSPFSRLLERLSERVKKP